MAHAGNKKLVQGILKAEPDWLGLVDRDEWTSDELTQRQRDTPNLLVLPRFCLESYLIDPAELWAAFPEKQRLKVPGGEETLRNALLLEKARWVRHAALWHVINPLWGKLRALGFKDGVLDSNRIPDDGRLLEALKSWHDFLDAQKVFAEFQTRLAEVQALDEQTLFARWLYAKNFYPQVVHRELDKLLGQKPARGRRLALFKTRSVPDDLIFVWQHMGLMQ
ncbi:MAG: hypothetical protein Q8O33_18930 [Pseudomonadota bacterium]|nr:hypothetical protein [Pseudomonadota bacterium]